MPPAPEAAKGSHAISEKLGTPPKSGSAMAQMGWDEAHACWFASCCCGAIISACLKRRGLRPILSHAKNTSNATILVTLYAFEPIPPT